MQALSPMYKEINIYSISMECMDTLVS